MAVIFALLLVLWVVGRSEKFALCTGHGNGPKIDFILSEYFAVAWYPRAGRNLEICFQKARRVGGLHNFLGFCIAKPVQKPSWTEPRGIGRYGILTVFC